MTLGHNTIPHLAKQGKVIAHPFSRSCMSSASGLKPYWHGVETVDAFWQANCDLTDFTPPLDTDDNK